jgi:hypothetical protein
VSDDTQEYGMALGVVPSRAENGAWFLATTIAHGAVTATIGIPLGREEEFIGEMTRMIRSAAREGNKLQRKAIREAKGFTVVGNEGA